jgi:peroxiredoxin
VQILGISANNPFSQKTFAESLKLPYPLLSDFPNLSTIRSYGGLTADWTATTAQRWFFLIDKGGVVQGQWRGTAADVFPSEPILKRARELRGRP